MRRDRCQGTTKFDSTSLAVTGWYTEPMRKPWSKLAIALVVLAVLAGAFVGDKVLAGATSEQEALRALTELLASAHDRYGDEVTYRDLVFSSIDGMLRALDPHTNFLSPKDYSGMRERQQSSFFGLGILVSMRNAQLTVVTPIEGTPASRLGIRAGDVISTIEGEPTDTMTLDEAIDKLKGPKGTQVRIEIVRRGLSEPLGLTVTRAEIPQNTVRQSYMLDDQTGYIWLTDFNRASGEEMERAIAALKAKGMKRLLFDMRNNGGGLLDQAIAIAEQFVPESSMIVETRGRTPDSLQSFTASQRSRRLDLPVIVLVNRGTASAAEIVSGAIQDHDVGLILGTPTWGKGLVQTVYNLPYGAGLALTTAKYYTPAGRLIQRDYSHYYDYVIADSTAGTTTATSPQANEKSFRTDLGRSVYGGGGITPDVVVEVPDLKPFEGELLAKNAFLNFAVDYVNQHPDVGRDWRATTETLADLRTWLAAQKLFTEQEITEGFASLGESDYIKRVVSGEVLNARFGAEAQHRAITESDPQIQRALQMFDSARDLLARRTAMEHQPLARPSDDSRR